MLAVVYVLISFVWVGFFFFGRRGGGGGLLLLLFCGVVGKRHMSKGWGGGEGWGGLFKARDFDQKETQQDE